jgi:hypothetical protein
VRHDIPTTDQVEVMLDDIIDYATKLRELWKWAAPSIYERPRRKGMDINPSAAKRPEDFQLKPRGAGPGSNKDPIGDIVTATDRFRTKIRHAGGEIEDAANRLGTASADINDAMLLLNPPPGPEVADVRLLPHPSTPRDMAQAQAAQARRLARARRTGDWDEVTG